MGQIDFDDFGDDATFAELEAAQRENLGQDFDASIEFDDPTGGFVSPPPPPPPAPGFPELPLIDDLIEAFIAAIKAPLEVIASEITDVVNSVIKKVKVPIDAIGGALDILTSSITRTFDKVFTSLTSAADRVIQKVKDSIGETFQAVVGFISGIVNGIISGLSAALDVIQSTITQVISAILSVVNQTFSIIQETVIAVLQLIGEKVTQAIGASAQFIELTLGPPLAKLAEAIPFQIQSLGTTVTEAFSSFLDIPEKLGEKIKEVFTDLGNAFGLDSLVSLSRIFGQFAAESGFNPSITDVLSSASPDDSSDLEINHKSSAFLAAIPIVGTFFTTLHPAIYEKIRQRSFELDRPTLLGVPDGLELLRRFPEEAESVIADLQKQGWPNERIEQLTRLRFQLTPVADTLDAWRRGFVDDDGLKGKLNALGWSEEDQALLRKLTFRIPPIQDMILFAIRGVFDVEESRAFGEFEGLPSELEAEFIRQFDIEGGDFSRQVEVFATEAQKLGLSPEWVAAYWTSHWRLPSLQTAYEMFHRLQPDILQAESERVQADGFTVAELEFTRPELDRLVRAQDFSSFWRPKLAAIAFNPLTRVDIRRMHKLGLLERDAVVRAYRKVGFSPSDAELMTLFTEAFNAEPDQDQAIELRSLTKTVVLDFVENGIFSPEEGVEGLKAIGYDKFAAAALVDLELAKVERGLQRDQIDLIEEQVKLGVLDINAASVELDGVGVPAPQKEVIIRKLGVQIAPRPASPSKSDLDNFLNQRVIDVPEYRLGLTERGFSDASIDLYVKLDRRLPTRKELDAFFIDDTISLVAYHDGLRDLGYSQAIIELFSASVQQDKVEAREERV